MARLETWYKQDLKRPLVVHKHTDVFNQDSKGNLIGVEVYSDGEPVVLSGSISGYCLLADGTTVPVVGASRSGNKASVLIPQTAYSVPGPITITIKNVEEDNITTLCATVGVVRQSVSGNLVNPGSVVTDWSNDINAQLQAVQTAADNVGAIVAASFDENTVYVAGNYVTNNGNLYRITADHAAGVAWANTQKTQCTVGIELFDLKSALNYEEKFTAKSFGTNPNDSVWTTGIYSHVTGSSSSGNIYVYINEIRYRLYGIRTVSYINNDFAFLKSISNIYMALYAFDASDTYVGCWNGTEFTTENGFAFSLLDIKAITESFPEYKFRCCAFNVETSERITVADTIKYIYYCNDIQSIESDINEIRTDIEVKGTPQYVDGWSPGYVNPLNGGSSASPKHCRTSTFEFLNSGNYIITPKQDYAVILNEYNGTPSASTFVKPLINDESQPKKVEISSSSKYRFCVSRIDGTDITPESLPSDVVTYHTTGKVSDKVTELDARVTETENAVANVAGTPQLLIPSVLFPCYDHLFVNNNGNKSVIPHESIYHVNVSRSLGFRVIEANVQTTSDGHYFVNHLDSGTFGQYFYSVDGSDISAVKANEVTWQWIEENVRYMSTVPKYRTRPTTLEEFLIGCKQNQLIPLLKFLDNNIKEMTERIMGKNNYIVYGGTREMAGDAVIFRWESYSTLEDILAFCDSIGKPLIYGTSKFNTSFSKAESIEIIEELHKRGYMVCMSYEANEFWRRYRSLGIDFCGGTRTTNRLVTGNTYNLENIFNTDDFTVSGGTVTDNVITLTENGTITCANIDSANRQIAQVDLEVDFDGVLTLTGGLGEFRGDIDFDSTDGKLIVCTAVINKPVNFILTAKGGSATINSIKYKVSIC